MASVYWNNNRVFAAFAEVETIVARHLAKENFFFFSFSEKIIRERLAQRFVEVCFYDYSKLCFTRYAHAEDPLPRERVLKLSGLRVDQETGQLKISISFFCNCFLKFCFLWLRLFWYIISSIRFSGSSKKKPTTLMYGVLAESIFYNDSDKRFITYLNSGPITPVTGSGNRIVYYTKKQQSQSDKNVLYHPLPVEALIRNGSFGFFQLLSLLKEHSIAFFVFLFTVIRHPLLAVLYSDAAYSSVIKKMDGWRAIDHVIISNANFQQYTWMRATEKNFRVHQVYYSQNIKPLIFRQDPIAGDYPAYKHMKVDEMWVWTEDIGNYLRELGFEGTIHVTGPVLWYLPATVEKMENFDIIIFDITPINKKAELEYGVINNFYSTENLFLYINDIIQTCAEINEQYGISVRLFLKHKRTMGEMHDKTYPDFINKLVDSGKLSGLIDPKEDIYSLISKTGMSVTIPFSSTSIIAGRLNKPAVVYDFSESLINNYAVTENISFVSGKKELKQKIVSTFGLEKNRNFSNQHTN
ncbi:MAG: polysaccharide biosynthesis PFTS motif protein [Bacteroidota bacterium]